MVILGLTLNVVPIILKKASRVIWTINKSRKKDFEKAPLLKIQRYFS